MAQRGDQLRERILWAAKSVFLEFGFERASMDVVAARAQTSKRSLYAHFESKEKLFLAVIALARELFGRRLKQLDPYAKPEDALTAFCTRYLEALLFQPSIQMMRVSAAEAERFPEQAAAYFDVLFAQVEEQLRIYLKATFKLSTRVSTEAAQTLLGGLLYPRLPRALLALDRLATKSDEDGPAPKIDARPVRKAVADLIEGFSKH